MNIRKTVRKAVKEVLPCTCDEFQRLVEIPHQDPDCPRCKYMDDLVDKIEADLASVEEDWA